jgi:hypothetical protein
MRSRSFTGKNLQNGHNTRVATKAVTRSKSQHAIYDIQSKLDLMLIEEYTCHIIYRMFLVYLDGFPRQLKLLEMMLEMHLIDDKLELKSNMPTLP